MYQIQEFSQKTGISKRMLRYLEEQGLLVPERRGNDYRLYRNHHLEQLQLIRFWQSLGFSLQDIKTLKTIKPSELEAKITDLLSKQKLDLERHVDQLNLIRSTLKAIQKAKGALDVEKLPHALDRLSAWTTDARANLLSELNGANKDRIIYGPFPELDSLSQELSACLIDGRPLDINAVEFIKFGKCAEQLPAGEVLVWESRKDYQYFFAHVPESLLLSEENPDQIEAELQVTVERAISKALLPVRLESNGRLLRAAGINQFVGRVDVCARLAIALPNKSHASAYNITLLIPFLFIQAVRRGLNSDSAKLMRSLQESVVHLTEEQILAKTKVVSNENFLLTILLADAETRNQLFLALSDEAKDLVIADLTRKLEKVQESWQP